MAFERRWKAWNQAFSADGQTNGRITVLNSSGFYVGQTVSVKSNTQPSQTYKIKRIEGPNYIWLTGSEEKINSTITISVSQYLVIDSATIEAPEQNKPVIKPDEWEQYTHEQEPILAKRVIQVDKWGNFYDKENPFPVDAQLNAENITVDIVNPDTPLILNVPLAVADTEYAVAVPAGTKRFMLKIRDDDSKYLIAYNPGETTSNFVTKARGTTYESYDIDLTTDLTVYIQCNKASKILEVMIWKN